MTKSRARELVKAQKQNMTTREIAEKSSRILKTLTTLTVFQNADTVLTYVNYNQEVETLPLIAHCLQIGKTVLVPKVYGKLMQFHQITSVSELKPGKYGILEPDNEQIVTPDTGFMVMPGLAFDRLHNRAGYGGGFYDKYLAENPGIYKAAVAFAFQIMDYIETEPHDLKPDVIVTEQEIIC